MDLYLATYQHMGSRVTKRWQEHDSLDLDGMQTVPRESEQMEGENDTEWTVT